MLRKRRGIETLSFLLDLAPAWETTGIFSEHFIRSRLKDFPLWPKDEFARPLYNYISDLWKKKHVILGKNNEELTKKNS